MRTRLARLSLIVTLAAALFAGLPAIASAQEEEGESAWIRGTEIGLDVLLLRPLNLMQWGVGAALVLPASYLAAPADEGTKDDVVDTFWTIPTQNLFERKLGDI